MPLTAPYGTDTWLRQARDWLADKECPACGLVGLCIGWTWRALATPELRARRTEPQVAQYAVITCESCGLRFHGFATPEPKGG